MLDLEQPAPLDSDAVDTATPDTGDLPDSHLDATEGEQPELQTPEEVEEELEGIKLRGSKESIEKLKSERLMQADYTRKTQDVAETRKSLEAERTQFQETAKSHQEYIREVAQVVAVDERLAQFAQVNWQALNQQDPVQAQALHIEFTQLQARRGQLVGTLTQKQQQRQLEAQQIDAKRANEAEAVVMREIKDWGPEKHRQFMEYGKKSGLEPESVRKMLIEFPQAAKFLDKALTYDKVLAQRVKKPMTEPAAPVTRVGGGAAASTKPLSEVSDAEYNRRRREYISKHR